MTGPRRYSPIDLYRMEIADLEREVTAYQIAKDNALLRGMKFAYEENWRDTDKVVRYATEDLAASNPLWQVY